MVGIKKTTKKIIVLIFCPLLLSIIGMGLMLLVYAIPTNENLTDNAVQSLVYFQSEGTYPTLMNAENSKLDNFTDALMLNIACFSQDKNAFSAALQNEYGAEKDGDMIKAIQIIAEGNQSDLKVENYGKYWNGYLFFLKPLLLFFSYGNIRSILCMFHIVLLSILMVMVAKKNELLVVPIVILEIFLNPAALLISIQFSVISLITYLASIVVARYHDCLIKNDYLLHIVFMSIGCLASFFDLLTFPILSLGIPLVLLLVLEEENLKGLKMISVTISTIGVWGYGYAINWVNKWIIGTLFTDSNYFKIALINIKRRTSSKQGDMEFSYFDVIKQQIIGSRQYSWLLLILIMVIVFLALMYSHKLKCNWQLIVSLTIISVIPLVWYAVLKNHSYIHFWFTYRNFGVSVMAWLCMLTGSVGKYFSNDRKYR